MNGDNQGGNQPTREVVHHEKESSSGLWAILVVILVLIIIGFFVFVRPTEDTNGEIDVNISLPTEEGASTESTE